MPNQNLSDEQAVVATLPYNAHALVLAGPGTGKTHLLTHRIQALLRQGLQPSEILVISFSRAAVAEVLERLRPLEAEMAAVRVRTLDSLASALLLRRPPPQDSNDAAAALPEGFDGRIREATCFLREESVVAATLLNYRHIIVDEVQDIVGLRSAYVAELLQVNDPGFTLLGDPAQNIYGFLEEESGDMPDLLTLVRARFGVGLQKFTLNEAFRCPKADTQLVDVGIRLRADEYRGTPLLRDLERCLARLAPVDMTLLTTMLRNPGTHAILCSTGLDVLYLSRELNEFGIVHRVRQGMSEETRWSSFLFAVLKAMPGSSISRSTFLTAYPKEVAAQWLAAEDAWVDLRTLAGSRDRFLRLDDVVRGMRFRRPPHRMSLLPKDKVLISTVHRAKGLEFQTVYLYGIPLDFVPLETQANECYVALTRTKGKTFNIIRQKHPDGSNKGIGRWRVPMWHIGRRATSELEICRSDSADDLLPPLAEAGFAGQVQDYIARDVHRGDAISLRRLAPERDDWCDYKIVHKDRTIGRISGRGIRQALPGHPQRQRMPDEIGELFVESVEAVAGVPGASRQSGLGGLDVWLRVLVTGLGRLAWTSPLTGEQTVEA